MNSFVRGAFVSVATIAVLAAPAFAQVLDMAQLRTMLENMGDAVKVSDGTEAAPTRLEVQMKSGGYDIPVGFEISPSGRYIWATAFLGSAASIDGARALALLKKNAEIQPSSFYITSKNSLMIAYAVDNRALGPAHMKFVLDKLANDISGSASVWQPPAPAGNSNGAPPAQ